MAEDRDIYKKKAPPPQEPTAYPEVDITPRDMRVRAAKRATISIILIAVILGLAVFVFRVLDERAQRADLEELTEEELAALVTLRERERRPEVAMPQLPPELERLRDEAPADLAPARAAQAMGHLRVAHQYLREQEWEAGELEIRQALQIWPDMPAAYNLLGFIFTSRGQFDQAATVIQHALKLDPFSVEAYNTLATIYIHKGEMAQAEDLLLSSIDLRPDVILPYKNLGMLYLLEGEFSLAAEYFEHTLEHMPDNTSVRNNLAVCLLRMGRYREAQAHLQQLIDSFPHIASFYFNMAITYTEQQDFENALSWVKQAAEVASPIGFQRYMSDPDFDVFRGTEAYQEFVESRFPNMPERIQL